MTTPNYADARAMALRPIPDTLIIERTSYGFRFWMGWGALTPLSMWYYPDIDGITSVNRK